MPVAVPASGNQSKGAKAVRGAAQFADQLAELEKIRVGIAAGGDDAKSTRTLMIRGDAILREMAGKAKLPDWLDKAERMRWRRCANQAETEAPRKKKPRKPTPSPLPVIKKTGPWVEEPNGTRSREIVSVEDRP